MTLISRYAILAAEDASAKDAKAASDKMVKTLVKKGAFTEEEVKCGHTKVCKLLIYVLIYSTLLNGLLTYSSTFSIISGARRFHIACRIFAWDACPHIDLLIMFYIMNEN